MKYVIDASVALKWILPEVGSDKALRLRDNWRNQNLELIAPDFFPAECGHSIVRAERRGIIPPGGAAVFITQLLLDAPTLHISLPLISSSYAIATQFRIGFYDAIYVALAEQENCELITADQRLVVAARQYSSCVVDLASLP